MLPQTMVNLPDDAVTLAECQYGVLSRRQLLGWLPAPVLDGHVRRGAFERLARGVYRVTGGVAVPGQVAVAAALRAGPTAVLTGPFVLAHHRLEGFDPDAAGFEVLLRPGRTLRNVPFPTRTDPHPARAVQKVGHIRLANKVDALLESCLWRHRHEDRKLRVAYHQLRYHHGVTTARMRRRVEARGGDDPAVAAFLDVVEGDLVSESEGERALAPVLSRLQPRPEPQIWVTPRRRVDWYLRALRFGWEYLGEVDHQHAEGRRADAERDAELASQGIRLHYVTAADLDDASAFLAATMAVLALRADQLGVGTPSLTPRHQPAH